MAGDEGEGCVVWFFFFLTTVLNMAKKGLGELVACFLLVCCWLGFLVCVVFFGFFFF